MTFIKDLNRLRNAGRAEQAGEVKGPNPAGVQEGGGVQQPGAKEPELRGGGGKPAPKKGQGLGGAALRQTIGDLFSVAEGLGLPGPMIAKYAPGMDQHVAAMKDASARIQRALGGMDAPARALAEGLPAQLVLAMSKGLGGLDQTSAGTQIRQMIEVAAEIIEGPRKLTGAHARSLEYLAHAVGQLGVPDLAGEVKRGAKSILGKNDAPVLEAAVYTLDNTVPTIVASTDLATRAPMFRAALETSLAAAADPNRPAAELVAASANAAKAVLNDGQKQILSDFAGAVRQYKGERDNYLAQMDAQVAGLRQAYDQQLNGPSADKLAPLADVRERVEGALTSHAQSLWYGQVNAYVGHDAGAVNAIGRVELELLEHAAATPPTPELMQQVSQSLVALTQIPGVTPEAIKELASDHVRAQPPERLPGTLAILFNVLTQLRNQNVNLQAPGELAQLANALIGRTDAFAAQNGPANQLIAALAGAADPKARQQALAHGARFAHALSTQEPGPARDLMQGTFAEDINAVARKGLDLASLAAAYKLVPEEGLAHFVAIAEKKGVDVDQFLDKLSQIFKHARGNKEHIRGIRNFVALADQGGADVPKFIDALLAAKPKSPVVTRTINALLHENNLVINAEQIENAIGMIQRGENVASTIEAKLKAAMVQKLNLNQLLQDAQVKVTDSGYAEVTTSLAQFFSLGANSAAVDKNLLKGMLIAVLEDRFPSYRFETPPARQQLACLDAEQQRAWMKSEVMTHVRFDANGKAEFDKRVKAGAAIAGAMLEKMTASWGQLDQLVLQQKQLAEQLRNIDKNDRAARVPIVRQISELPGKISAMSWAKELAEMTPETTTPLRFAAMGDKLPTLGRSLGPAFGEALNELTWTVRIDDLSYSQVVTNDGPDLTTMYRLASSQCLRGWPNDVALLAYCIDANKRMIVTKNQAGEERRSMMRLVTRTDEGHVGEPMLVLERSYPDAVAEEEKQRLIEHMLRRAVEMGISAAYPTEYYWDSSQTGRRIMDMNAVLEDLNRRYNTSSEIKVTSVTSHAGNVNPEYIDSAPPGGVGNAGVVGIRRYNGQQDNTYENKFLILTPKKD